MKIKELIDVRKDLALSTLHRTMSPEEMDRDLAIRESILDFFRREISDTRNFTSRLIREKYDHQRNS